MSGEAIIPSWKTVSVSDVSNEVFDGPFGSNLKTLDYTETGVRVVRLENIGTMRFIGEKETFISPTKYETLKRHTLYENDIVFSSFISERIRVTLLPKSWSGRSINKSDCFCIRLDQQKCLPEFLVRRLASHSTFITLEENIHGATRPRINLTQIKEFSFDLPPLPEQKRIADKLELVLGRVDACRARLDRVPALLKRFRQSVLAAATSGKLTEEWREENGVDEEWEEVRVQDVANQVFDGPFGSHLKTADYTPSGVRVARLENIGWMTFLAEKEAFISQAKHKTLLRHTLKKDDVVFSSFISEETRVALLPESWSGKAINKSDCYCVRVDQDRCLPRFMMLRLACRSTFHLLGEEVHGATRPRINLRQLNYFTFILPLLPEQAEIVRRVEALFALADRIEARLATAQKTVERLTPATLAEAFRGELVPQDPNDEPASELLDRIASAEPARRTRLTARGRKHRGKSP